jgi:hypothetical protein
MLCFPAVINEIKTREFSIYIFFSVPKRIKFPNFLISNSVIVVNVEWNCNRRSVLLALYLIDFYQWNIKLNA